MRHLGALPDRRARRRLARAAGVVLALLALLPSVFPYDHVLPVAAHPHDHADARTAHGATESHEQHCHGNASSCSDAPVPAGPGQMIGSDLLAVAPAGLVPVLVVPQPALVGIAEPPEVRPPVRALPLTA